ncbi:MAG: hypothetical protein JW893_00375 [Candidatus Omnitrophica bacterium]|nr:hypothetical protein [Candidatus Omnitrophota bacterium]
MSRVLALVVAMIFVFSGSFPIQALAAQKELKPEKEMKAAVSSEKGAVMEEDKKALKEELMDEDEFLYEEDMENEDAYLDDDRYWPGDDAMDSEDGGVDWPETDQGVNYTGEGGDE